MAIGGFNGTDPSPTLAQFQAYVAPERSTTSSPAAAASAARGGSNAVVRDRELGREHFTASTVGGITIYDLTATK